MSASIAANVTTSSGIILPADPGRSVWMVQNPSGSGQTVWVRENAAASAGAGSFEIPPGQTFTGRGGAAIHAIAGAAVSVTVGDW